MKNIIKDKKGITLMSLIVTIIILILLAGITLSLVLGQNGLIAKAQYAKSQSEISGEKEQLSMATSEATLDNTGTQATLDQMKDKIVEKGITTGENIKVGDDRLQTTTPKGHTYTIDQNGDVEYIGEGAVTVPNLTDANVVFIYTPSSWINGNVQVKITTAIKGFTLQYSTDGSTWNNYTNTITITNNQAIYARLWDGINYGGVATGNITNIDRINPTLTIATTNTTNSITITSTGVDNESGVAGYKYSIDNGSTWTDLITDSTYTFTGLIQGQTYQIAVQVYDKAGNTVSKNALVTVGSVTGLTSANTTFTYTPSAWTNGNVQVGITTTETGYTLQYSTDGSTWNTYTNAIAVTSSEAIYARLWDGTNYGGVTTGNITNIDRINPTLTISTTNTTNSITITVAGADNESGIAGYKYSKNNGAAWTDLITDSTYTFTGLTQGQAYQIVVQAYDKAGNTVSKSTTVTTGLVTSLTASNTTFTYTLRYPRMPEETEWTCSNNEQLGITTTATGYTLQYSTDGSTWKTYTSAITLISNGIIYARLYDGTNYGGVATSNVTNIDNTNPTLTLNQDTNSTIRTITITATDSQSGILEIQDDGAYHDLATSNITNGEGATYQVTVDGTYTFSAYDRVGNKTSQSITVTGLLVGSFVNYTAGTWTQADINSLGGLYAGASLPTSSNPNQFGGFSVGSSKDNSVSARCRNNYSSGWRILDLNADRSIKDIVHAGTTEGFYYLRSNYDSDAAMQQILTNTRNWNMYVNGTYATSAHCMTYNEVCAVMRKSNQSDLVYSTDNDLINTGSFYWLAGTPNNDDLAVWNTGGVAAMSSICVGIRPVVTLKSGIQITGGSGTQADPYRIN